MKTLEEVEVYFKERDYIVRFLTYKREDEPRKLLIQGRRGLPDSLEIIRCGSSLFILLRDNLWQLESQLINYYRLLATFEHLSDALVAAEAILGPPLESQIKQMKLLEDAQLHFQSKGYNAQIFEDEYPPQLMVLGRRMPSDLTLPLMGYRTEVFILMTMDTVWHLQSPAIKEHGVRSTFHRLSDAVTVSGSYTWSARRTFNRRMNTLEEAQLGYFSAPCTPTNPLNN